MGLATRTKSDVLHVDIDAAVPRVELGRRVAVSKVLVLLTADLHLLCSASFLLNVSMERTTEVEKVTGGLALVAAVVGLSMARADRAHVTDRMNTTRKSTARRARIDFPSMTAIHKFQVGYSKTGRALSLVLFSPQRQETCVIERCRAELRSPGTVVGFTTDTLSGNSCYTFHERTCYFRVYRSLLE
eukprot:scpid81809/ scgid11480/ 